VLRLGTRGSTLALEQTRRIGTLLERTGHVITEPRILETRGDRDTETPLPQVGVKGVFTEALERALLNGDIDIAVHSLKDLPVEDRPGLRVGAVCLREDAHDALVARGRARLSELRRGAVVGTSSTRRTAQLRAVRPDIVAQPIRGNVETRCRKVAGGDYDAVVLAYAGLLRTGLDAQVTEVLSFDDFLPAPGQGALAVQCRGDDAATLARLTRIDEPAVRACTEAERTFLAELGGGCSLPIAALAEPDQAGGITMRGMVLSPDGSARIEVRGQSLMAGAASLGRSLAADARARGAAELLA
jgi:hydroxymethylbilane synthase